jgi:hypothetical protein
VIEYSVAKEEALLKLELFNRQVYLSGLNREDFEAPAKIIFPDIKPSTVIFWNCLVKTQRDFKNWKTLILTKLNALVKA